MKKILLITGLFLGDKLYSQNIKNYIFPDGIQKATFNYTKADGSKDDAFKMVYEYLLGDQGATVFVSNYYDDNVVSRKKEEFYITDTAIYLVNTNTKNILSYDRENYMGYSNCFLKLPQKGKAISWIYKETKETSYKCDAISVKLTVEGLEYSAIKVDKTPFESGKYLESYKSSVYYVEGKGLYKEIPLNGKKPLYILSSTEKNSSKLVELTKATEDKDDFQFAHVEVAAQFPGGDKKYRPFLDKNLIMTKAAEDNSINGIVTVSFLVKEDGSIENIKVEEGLGYGCDEAAVSLVKSFPKWVPAQDKGRNVASIVRLPISFRNAMKDDNELSPDSLLVANDLIDLNASLGIFKVVSSIGEPTFFIWGQKTIYLVKNRKIEKQWQIIKILSAETDIDYRAKTNDGEIYIYPKYHSISITNLKGEKNEFRWKEILQKDLEIDPKYIK